MKNKVRLAEIIIAGVIAATLSACISAFQAGCTQTASGNWQCHGDADVENNVVGL